MQESITGNREDRLLQSLGDSVKKLELAEIEYIRLVLELEARLEPFYSNADVRRVIAECSDAAREIYREILALRAQVGGKPNERAIQLLADRVEAEALRARRNEQDCPGSHDVETSSKEILQGSCNADRGQVAKDREGDA